MKTINHNSCKFEIVRYYSNNFIVRITPICGVFTNGEFEKYVTDSLNNLTSLEEWVLENY